VICKRIQANCDSPISRSGCFPPDNCFYWTPLSAFAKALAQEKTKQMPKVQTHLSRRGLSHPSAWNPLSGIVRLPHPASIQLNFLLNIPSFSAVNSGGAQGHGQTS
jgi:hypothetical protein